jgi:CubicO group peptidase (beta-lactamase class C family)
MAVAVIDISDDPSIRYGFIAADGATPFEIGSVTKALTGMLLADAIKRREISLDSAVRDVIPHAQGTAFGSITAKELCTHTSGLPRMPQGPSAVLRTMPLVFGLDPYGDVSAARMLQQAAREPLLHRGDYRHSNLGGAVLGQLLALRAHTHFSLLTERILRPLDMGASTIGIAGDGTPWGRSASGFPRQPWRFGGYAPAGGVVSTIEDMARLTEALLNSRAPGLDSMNPLAGASAGLPQRTTGMCWVIDSPPLAGTRSSDTTAAPAATALSWPSFRSMAGPSSSWRAWPARPRSNGPLPFP